MPSQLIHRHDQYFKRLLDQQGTAAALLRERLPPQVAARLTDDPPDCLPISFISDELGESRTDRLYRTRTRDDRPVLVYTLVEHKSSPDPRVGFQLLGYSTSILKWWDENDGRSDAGNPRKLPILLSIVVYNGEAKWKIPLTLAEATEGGDDEELRPWLIDLRYTLVDLGRTPDHALSRHRLLGFGFKVLKYGARKVDPRQTLRLLLRDALEVGGDEVYVFIRFVLNEPNDLERQVVRQVLAEVAPGKEDRIMSIALQEWKAEWQAEAKAEGISLGRVETLLRLIQRRFGPLPEDSMHRVQGATSQELDRLEYAIFEARTLDELLPNSQH